MARILVTHDIRYRQQAISDTVSLEGPWSEVSQAIHDCHAAVHAKGAQRIATDIRIGTRIDKEIPNGQGNDLKVKRVQDILDKEIEE